jgi:hypothetical protein
MALIKHPWTLLDIAAGNRGSTPLASKLFSIRNLPRLSTADLNKSTDIRAFLLVSQETLTDVLGVV